MAGIGGWLGTILGLNKNTAGDSSLKQQQGYVGDVTGNIAGAQSQANQWGGIANQFTPAYTGAVQDYGDYLKKSTTDQARQGYIANATANVGRSVQQQQANTADELAARGLGGSAGASGALVAGNNAQAAEVANAANNADQFFLEQHQKNLQDLAGLYGGVTQNALGNYNTETGVANNEAEYGAGEYGQMAQNAYQRQAEQDAQAQAGFGDILGGAGEIFGMKTAAPQTPSQLGLSASRGVQLPTLPNGMPIAPSTYNLPDYSSANGAWGNP